MEPGAKTRSWALIAIAWGRNFRLVLSPKQLYTYVTTNSGTNPNINSSDKYLCKYRHDNMYGNYVKIRVMLVVEFWVSDISEILVVFEYILSSYLFIYLFIYGIFKTISLACGFMGKFGSSELERTRKEIVLLILVYSPIFPAGVAYIFVEIRNWNLTNKKHIAYNSTTPGVRCRKVYINTFCCRR